MTNVPLPEVSLARAITGLRPRAVLRVGTNHTVRMSDLDGGWPTVTIDDTQVAAAQLDRRFDVVVLAIKDETDDGHRRAAWHTAVQHVDRDGHLVVVFDAEPPTMSIPADFIRDDDATAKSFGVYRRGGRVTVHDLLFEARATIARLEPIELAVRLSGADPPLVVDTRADVDRQRFGTIAGTVHVPRTVLEWQLDPSNGYVHPCFRSLSQPLVVVCNSGYSSSLSAANLVRIGFTDVADLVGGHHGWCAAGLPVCAPDHSFLDLAVDAVRQR